MLMNEPYTRSYSALGLKPGSSWDEVRDAYRTLITKWHPDRFQQDSQNRKLAEEESMEITRAYKILADYYRKHGSTPTDPSPAPASAARNPETARPPEPIYRPAPAVEVPESATHAEPAASTPIAASRGKIFFVLPAIAMLLYLWFTEESVVRGPDIQTAPKSTVQDGAQPVLGSKAASYPADQFFTLGSKLGAVYEIQGVPSKTEQGIWHYGKSRVYFINGSVSHWDSHPENPLQASLVIDPVDPKKAFIVRGSTKDEVRALQGTPWRQTESEWTYGSSRIFFSGDLVTGWEESTVNPLKVQR